MTKICPHCAQGGLGECECSSELSRGEIQKRFNVITKKYREVKGYLVGFILARDGYIETYKNDKEVKILMEMHKDFENLIVDIAMSKIT